MTAVERAQHLAKSLQAQEVAARRAEEKTALLRLNFEKLQKAHLEAQEQHVREIAELQVAVDRKHAEAAVAEGALEAARRDRARLQMALLTPGDKNLAAAEA